MKSCLGHANKVVDIICTIYFVEQRYFGLLHFNYTFCAKKGWPIQYRIFIAL